MQMAISGHVPESEGTFLCHRTVVVYVLLVSVDALLSMQQYGLGAGKCPC